MARKTSMQGLIRLALPVVVLMTGVGAGAVIVNSRPDVETTAAAPELRSVNAMRVEPRTMRVTIHSQGTVLPQQRISLVPQVSGKLDWVSEKFVNGGVFASGELMVRIDDSDYRLAVTSLEAAVAEASQQLESIRAQAGQAEADWELLRRAGAADSLKPTALALRLPQLAGAEARLLSAQVELERARLQLARTALTAPFAAIVGNKQVDYGQYVNAGATLAELSSVDVFEVRLALPERELRRLDLASLGDVGVSLSRLGAAEEGRWQGVLVRSEGVVDERTRNLTVVARLSGEALLSDSGERLVPGQFLRAEIVGREAQDVVQLPRTALHNAHSVFVLDGENRLREREVSVLEVQESYILVDAGLDPGDLVSISPLTSSVEGQVVNVLMNEGVF